jgi:hypothetical protein
MGEVDDIHHPEDDRQAQGYHGQHHAKQKPGGYGAKKDFHKEKCLFKVSGVDFQMTENRGQKTDCKSETSAMVGGHII